MNTCCILLYYPLEMIWIPLFLTTKQKPARAENLSKLGYWLVNHNNFRSSSPFLELWNAPSVFGITALVDSDSFLNILLEANKISQQNMVLEYSTVECKEFSYGKPEFSPYGTKAFSFWIQKFPLCTKRSDRKTLGLETFTSFSRHIFGVVVKVVTMLLGMSAS